MCRYYTIRWIAYFPNALYGVYAGFRFIRQENLYFNIYNGKLIMEKQVIFCKNEIETLEYFSVQLAEAFEKRGYEILWLDFNRLALGAWKLRQALKGNDAVLVTFNFIGLSWEDGLWELTPEGDGQVSFWQKEGIRCLNIMVDHPVYYYEQLLHPAGDMQTFCIDRDHVAYMKRFYPEMPCAFLPSAGNRVTDCLPFTPELCNVNETEVRSKQEQCDCHIGPETDVPAVRLAEIWNDPEHGAGSLEQWLARPVPVVFTANYIPPANLEKQLDRLEPEYRDFYYELIGAFISHPEQELLTLTEQYMRREIPELTDGELRMAMRTMCAVDLRVRTYFREKTVRILAEGGIPVHIYGKDWEKMPCGRPENLIRNGHMDGSAQCARVTAGAKISLNVMPWFKDGAHDRIFTAMLHKTVALTDDSRYLRENFTDGRELVYYDLGHLEELPEQVFRLLRQPERMYDIAGLGYKAAIAHHTWERRAETLLSYL